MAGKSYGTLRLSRAMMESVAMLKLAFEATYLQTFTYDEFFQKLMDCVEDGDVAVWDTYCRIVEKHDGELNQKED